MFDKKIYILYNICCCCTCAHRANLGIQHALTQKSYHVVHRSVGQELAGTQIRGEKTRVVVAQDITCATRSQSHHKLKSLLDTTVRPKKTKGFDYICTLGACEKKMEKKIQASDNTEMKHLTSGALRPSRLIQFVFRSPRHNSPNVADSAKASTRHTSEPNFS